MENKNTMTDIGGASKILRCSVQQIYLLEQRSNDPLPVHYPTMKSFIKVYSGRNVFELLDIPENLIGGRRPKKIYFKEELRKWLENQ
jgi:hypothetical protein